MTKEIKKDCFAYTNKNGKECCHALTELDCKNCSFYKHRDKIKNNPFYAFSYSSEKKHRYAMEKRNIKEDFVKWD